jgi:uncharacterized protein involved in oxidation of intracellular sulfur
MILTIIVNDAPYGIEKPWNAFRLASTSISDGIGMTVQLFLMGDSVSAAKKGQKTPDGYYNMRARGREILREGLEMWEMFINGTRSIFYDDPELEQLEPN